MNHHKTIIHIRCPHAPVWDYYTIELGTDEFIMCETLQEACDEIRGKTMTQEDVSESLRCRICIRGTLTVRGRHGQNSELVVRVKTSEKAT